MQKPAITQQAIHELLANRWSGRAYDAGKAVSQEQVVSLLEAARWAGITIADMKILYGIVGEGMGHATRSKVILDELCTQGHEIAIVVSGRAHAFIARQFAARPNVTIEEIHGLTLDYDNNALDLSDSVLQNLKSALPGLAQNLEVYRGIAERRFRPDAVISDGTGLRLLEYLGRKDAAYLEGKSKTKKWFDATTFPYPVRLEHYGAEAE